MEVVEAADYAELSRIGADAVCRALARRPDSVLIPATGASPKGLYEELAARWSRGELDTSRLMVFQLDEFVGVSSEDAMSLYGWMRRILLQPLSIAEDRVVRLDSLAKDLESACRRYDTELERIGGLDVAILGLGENGHLGYNEPPSPRDAPTRVVELSPESRASAAQYFDGASVPSRAVTAGMARLLEAREILLLVSGPRKREILDMVLNGPITAEVPASWLRLASNATVIADREALGTIPSPP